MDCKPKLIWSFLPEKYPAHLVEIVEEYKKLDDKISNGTTFNKDVLQQAEHIMSPNLNAVSRSLRRWAGRQAVGKGLGVQWLQANGDGNTVLWLKRGASCPSTMMKQLIEGFVNVGEAKLVGWEVKQ